MSVTAREYNLLWGSARHKYSCNNNNCVDILKWLHGVPKPQGFTHIVCTEESLTRITWYWRASDKVFLTNKWAVMYGVHGTLTWGKIGSVEYVRC